MNHLINEEFTLDQAAEYAKITRSAVYAALRKNKFQARKRGRNWIISRQQLDDYRMNKYNRDDRKVNGEKVFDIERGYFSVGQVATLFSNEYKKMGINKIYPRNRLYYLLHQGLVKAHKIGAAWVIHKDEIIRIFEKETGIEAKQLRFA